MNRKEDKCRIEVQGEMTAERYASFTMLYVPLIGSDAAALYHTLVSIGTRNQKIRNHILIQTISRLSMEAMEKSRHVLEQYLLAVSYTHLPAGIESGFIHSIACVSRAIVVTTLDVTALQDADRICLLYTSRCV